MVETRRLAFTPPLFPDNLFGHLVATAVPGVEEWLDGAYRRSLRLAGGAGVVALAPRTDHVEARFTLAAGSDLDEAERLARRILDLDADPAAIHAVLGADPLLAPMVDAAPGRRVPGSPDPDEFALRAVLGQQVSTAAARTHTARLVTAHGDPLPAALASGTLTHLFPTPDALRAIEPDELRMPETRKRTVIGLVAALADPDAFLPTDLGVRVAAERLGLPARDRDLVARAEPWRPYRAYATQYLWAELDHAVNAMPG